MKSVASAIVVLCLIVGHSFTTAQEPANEALPGAADGLPTLTDAKSPSDETAETDATEAIPFAGDAMQVLRVQVNVQGEEPPLRAGLKVYFYQQAMFRDSVATCLIGGMTVDPCEIHAVHSLRGDQADVSLLVPQRLADHIAELPTKPGVPPMLFVRPVSAPRPALAKPAPANQKPVWTKQVLKLFALEQIKAANAERTIIQLFGNDVASLAADERTNSLIVRGDPAVLTEIEALLKRLDVAAELADTNPFAESTAPAGNQQPQPGSPDPFDAPNPNSNPAAARDNPFDSPEPASIRDDDPYRRAGQPNPAEHRRPSAGPANAAHPSAATLRMRLDRLEARSLQIASQLRSPSTHRSKQQQSPDHQQRMTAELRATVSAAFATRQTLQRTELATFHRRVQDLGESIKLRERISDQIIRRRVEDLLDPNLNWETEAVLPPTSHRQVADQSPVPSASPSLAATVTAEAARAESLQAGLQGKWVLDGNTDDPDMRHIVITGTTWVFFAADLKTTESGTFSFHAGEPHRFVVEFAQQGKVRAQWFGEFELDTDQLIIRVTAMNQMGLGDRIPSQADSQETLRKWTGVYHRALPNDRR